MTAPDISPSNIMILALEAEVVAGNGLHCASALSSIIRDLRAALDVALADARETALREAADILDNLSPSQMGGYSTREFIPREGAKAAILALIPKAGA